MLKIFMFFCKDMCYRCVWLFFFCIFFWGYSVEVVIWEYGYFWKLYILFMFVLLDLNIYFEILNSFMFCEYLIIYIMIKIMFFDF